MGVCEGVSGSVLGDVDTWKSYQGITNTKDLIT